MLAYLLDNQLISRQQFGFLSKCSTCTQLLDCVPFDRPYTTFYWSAIVNIALSCTVSELFDLNNVVTLKSGSFKLAPLDSLGAVSYSLLPSIVTMALSSIISEIK